MVSATPNNADVYGLTHDLILFALSGSKTHDEVQARDIILQQIAEDLQAKLLLDDSRRYDQEVQASHGRMIVRISLLKKKSELQELKEEKAQEEDAWKKYLSSVSAIIEWQEKYLKGTESESDSQVKCGLERKRAEIELNRRLSRVERVRTKLRC